MPHPKIAIIYPQLRVGGGSESTVLWILETLKKDYEVYLITMGEVDLRLLNECYGTQLKTDEINIISFPIPYLFRKRFDALRVYRLARFCKKHASEFDLMISAYNTMDFGRRGIQFIADFSFDDNIRRSFDFSQKGFKGLFYKQSPLRWLYLTIAKLLAGSLSDGWKRNLTIVNSDWSGQIMKEAHSIDCQTIYPPVAGNFPDIPWDKRENGFIVMARLVPEKRVDRIIEILREVRRRGYDIHLHILGRMDNSGYAMSLKRLCDENKEWVFMEGLVIGDKKLELIASHRFSISGHDQESFGIAVAEAVKAGCIVWVPNGGGQTEIVSHPDLIYDNIEDAMNRIENVLKNDDMQTTLRKHLSMQAEKFSIERFMEEIKEVVEQFLSKKTRESVK